MLYRCQYGTKTTNVQSCLVNNNPVCIYIARNGTGKDDPHA